MQNRAFYFAAALVIFALANDGEHAIALSAPCRKRRCIMAAYQVKTHPDHATYADGANGLQDRVRVLLAKIGNRLQARRSYYNSVAELSAMSDRDLADIGISRADIPAIARQAARAKYAV
jgi:uncharacterized protein YjiS (DUF1127 family)